MLSAPPSYENANCWPRTCQGVLVLDKAPHVRDSLRDERAALSIGRMHAQNPKEAGAGCPTLHDGWLGDLKGAGEVL